MSDDAVAICRNVIYMVEKNKTKRMLTSVFRPSPPFIRIDDRQCKVTTIINQPSSMQLLNSQAPSPWNWKTDRRHSTVFMTDTGCGGISPRIRIKYSTVFEKLNENAQGTGLNCYLPTHYRNWAKYGLTPP